MSESAANVPDESVCKAEDAIGDASGVEQLASKDEQRNRQEGEAVDTGRHALHYYGERHDGVHQQVQQRAACQGEGDGDFEHQEDAEEQEHQQDRQIHRQGRSLLTGHQVGPQYSHCGRARAVESMMLWGPWLGARPASALSSAIIRYAHDAIMDEQLTMIGIE